jgi:hypothetical protein
MFSEDEMETPAPKKRTPKKKEDGPDVELSSPWFKLKLDDIDYKTIIIIGMIIVGVIAVVKIII